MNKALGPCSQDDGVNDGKENDLKSGREDERKAVKLGKNQSSLSSGWERDKVILLRRRTCKRDQAREVDVRNVAFVFLYTLLVRSIQI